MKGTAKQELTEFLRKLSAAKKISECPANAGHSLYYSFRRKAYGLQIMLLRFIKGMSDERKRNAPKDAAGPVFI